MTIYRNSLMWNQSVMGVSETYWTGDISAGIAAKQVENLIQLRMNSLYQNQFVQGLRVAIEGSQRNSSLILPSGGTFADSGVTLNLAAAGGISTTSVSTPQTIVRNTLQVQIGLGTSRRAIRYFSGIPAGIVGTDPATYAADGGSTWNTAFNAFLEELTSGRWFVKCQNIGAAAPQAQVVGVTAQPGATGLIGLQVAATSMPAWAIGSKVYLTHMRAAKGTRASTMNGTWYVASVDTATASPNNIVYLRGSEGINPTTQRFTDKTFLRLVAYIYLPISDWNLYRVGIHKRGRPSLAPHGRRVRIASLDA